MRKKVQISFLGKVQGGPRAYQKARYLFPDGAHEETAFFGYGLARRERPDRLVVLGTTGSMWQVLLEEAGRDAQHEDLWVRLGEASAGNAVTDSDLERLSEALAGWENIEVRPRLIPYSQSLAEQTELLWRIAGEVDESDRVLIDITHGLRHLPLLGFTSALYLREVREAEVVGIYYGALDMRDAGRVPVLRLDGLLRVASWTAAVERFRESGDYGVFASLLEADGVEPDQASCLRRAAYLERTVQLEGARREISKFLLALKRGLPGAARLFEPHLKKQLSWVGDSRLGDYQRRLAWDSLRRGDYLRAAVFGYEAFVTALLRPGEDETDPATRDAAVKEYLLAVRGGARERQQFRRLRALRNVLAHAGPRRAATSLGRFPQDEVRLRAELRRLLERLLGPPRSGRGGAARRQV